MRPIIYIILLAIAALVFKAFFLDAYLAERKAAENNVTTEAAQTVETEAKPAGQAAQSQPKRIEMNETKDMKMMPNYKEAPLEKLGDKIAEKLDDKI